MNFDEALQVANRVGSVIHADPNGLMKVPEIEQAEPEVAIHKLQVQVIVLSDALAAVAQEVDRLRQQRR
jgi:hypothetical protein